MSVINHYGYLPRFAIAILLLILLISGCSHESSKQIPPQNHKKPQTADDTFRPDMSELTKGPISSKGLRAILGTADLAVGHNRLGFVVTHPEGVVTTPKATVSYNFPTNKSKNSLVSVSTANFQLWPYGERGLYSTEMNFHKPGDWELIIDVKTQDGIPHKLQLHLNVNPSHIAPSIGSMALKSRNKTVSDVKSLTQLSTGLNIDPDLYQTTLADAVVSGIPTVVVFASPGFCTNPVCGPQVEVLRELKNTYKGQANFIHIDLYDNPDEIQGDLNRAVISPIVSSWKLPSSEWTFIIDRRGIISSRFESFATLQELQEALFKVL